MRTFLDVVVSIGSGFIVAILFAIMEWLFFPRLLRGCGAAFVYAVIVWVVSICVWLTI